MIVESLGDLVFHLREQWGSRQRLLTVLRPTGTPRVMSAPELVADAHALALALDARGLRPGDRVAIYAANRPGWHVVDLGVQLVGGVTVPLWAQSQPSRVAFVLRNSGATWVFTDAVRTVPMRALLDSLGHSPTVVTVDEDGDESSLTALLGLGASLAARSSLERLRGRVGPDDPSTLLYTPGTTGDPKGVQLSHRAATAAIVPLVSALELGPDDEALALTPLAHRTARTFAHACLYAGAPLTYAVEGQDSLQALSAARPTVLATLPAAIDAIYREVCDRWQQRTAAQREALWRSVSDSAHWEERRTLRVGTLRERLGGRLARRRLHEIRSLTGGRLRLAQTFGGPVTPETETLLRAAGLTVGQSYGVAEVGELLTLTTREAWRPGSAGRLCGESKLHRRSNGELLARGPGAMESYWRDPEASAAAHDELGWYTTGDIGRIDREGFLFLEGRDFARLLTIGGHYVDPGFLERRLGLAAEIRQSVVVGHGRPYLAALVVPRALGELHAVSGAAWPRVERAVRDLNRRLQSPEQIRRFFLLPRELSVASGELTPAGEVRRHVVHERYAAEIESMYA